MITKLKNSFMENGVLHVEAEGEELLNIYNIFRVAILGNKIPLRKVIGFTVRDTKRATNSTLIRRGTTALENMLEVSKNLSKLVFLNEKETHIIYATVKATSNSNDILFINKNNIKDEQRVLIPVKILTPLLEAVELRLIVKSNTGNVSIEENISNIYSILNYKDNKRDVESYVPIDTEYSLIDYVRVLPFDGETIRYKIINVEESDINILWRRYVGGLSDEFKI